MPARLDFSARVTLTGDWALLRRLLNPARFLRDLEREANRATFLNAKDFARTARRFIRGSGYDANSPLTVQIKGSAVPLLDYGDLLAAIDVTRIDRRTYFSGVPATARWSYRPEDGTSYVNPHRDGRTLLDVAEILHEGFIVRFTAAVLRAIMAKLAARQRTTLYRTVGLGAPGSLLNTVRIVPPRPWVRVPFEDRAFQERCVRRWLGALEYALTLAAGRGELLPGAGTNAASAVFEER